VLSVVVDGEPPPAAAAAACAAAWAAAAAGTKRMLLLLLQVCPDGLLVSFCGFFHGAIDHCHLGSPVPEPNWQDRCGFDALRFRVSALGFQCFGKLNDCHLGSPVPEPNWQDRWGTAAAAAAAALNYDCDESSKGPCAHACC
jgi:hypothetical protein